MNSCFDSVKLKCIENDNKSVRSVKGGVCKMANIKSAIKRAKTSQKKRMVNKMQKSALKSHIKTFEGLLASDKIEEE